MLTVSSGTARDCSGCPRRDFLVAGMLGLGGLPLAHLLTAKAAARAGGKSYVRDRSIVLLFLGGGASHIETFNPNLKALAPFCSVTGEVKTKIPGLTPQSDLGPCVQSPQARLVGAIERVLRQIFPRHPRLQDEQDGCQHLAV